MIEPNQNSKGRYLKKRGHPKTIKPSGHENTDVAFQKGMASCMAKPRLQCEHSCNTIMTEE